MLGTLTAPGGLLGGLAGVEALGLLGLAAGMGGMGGCAVRREPLTYVEPSYAYVHDPVAIERLSLTSNNAAHDNTTLAGVSTINTNTADDF